MQDLLYDHKLRKGVIYNKLRYAKRARATKEQVVVEKQPRTSDETENDLMIITENDSEITTNECIE